MKPKELNKVYNMNCDDNNTDLDVIAEFYASQPIVKSSIILLTIDNKTTRYIVKDCIRTVKGFVNRYAVSLISEEEFVGNDTKKCERCTNPKSPVKEYTFDTHFNPHIPSPIKVNLCEECRYNWDHEKWEDNDAN